MVSLPSSFASILEISRQADGSIPTDLVSAAYLASRTRPVGLILSAVSPTEIDRVLDPIVATAGKDLRGVVYVDGSDDAAVLEAAVSASRIFAGTAELRAKLTSRGIRYGDVCDAEKELIEVPGSAALVS